jgi:predicted PurR-regulated permease PerM
MARISPDWSRIALLLVALVVVAGALKLAAIAILPVVAALLLCLLLWPLRRVLARVMPRWIAAGLCCLVLAVMLLAVGGWGWYAVDRALDRFEGSREQYVQQYQSLRSTLTGWGVPQGMVPAMGALEGQGEGQGQGGADGEDRDGADGGGSNRAEDEKPREAPSESEPEATLEGVGDRPDTPAERRARSADMRERITRLVAGGVRTTLGVVVALVLTLFLAYLALVEGDRWASWARTRWRPDFYSTMAGLVHTWSRQTRRHFFAKTCSGVISGAATGLWLWAMGVPMPLVWAMLTLLLNYVPNVGAFVSGAPPTLLAIVELGWGPGLAVAAGLWVIETLVGNLIDPKLEGDFLRLSTFVVLASMVFWGWLWGVVGAVLSPVLTAGLWALYEQRERLLAPGRTITRGAGPGERTREAPTG